MLLANSGLEQSPMTAASGRNGDMILKPGATILLRSLKVLKNCNPVAAMATTHGIKP